MWFDWICKFWQKQSKPNWLDCSNMVLLDFSSYKVRPVLPSANSTKILLSLPIFAIVSLRPRLAITSTTSGCSRASGTTVRPADLQIVKSRQIDCADTNSHLVLDHDLGLKKVKVRVQQQSKMVMTGICADTLLLLPARSSHKMHFLSSALATRFAEGNCVSTTTLTTTLTKTCLQPWSMPRLSFHTLNIIFLNSSLLYW